MSPAALPPTAPRPSRLAVAVYALCGVVGAAGVFAAVRDVAPVEAAVVPADVDARRVVGLWQSDSADVFFFDAAGSGHGCVGGAPRDFRWSVRGSDVVDEGGRVVASVDGDVLRLGSLTFHRPGGTL